MKLEMTTGQPLRRILAFCGPVLAGNLFQQFYNLADSFLVGRIIGLNAFAAVGSTGALSFLVTGFALGTCSGLAIPIAQSYGAGNYPQLRRRAGQLVWLGLLISLLLMAVSWLWTDDILRITQTPAELFDEAYRYILIVFLGAGATVLYNLLSAVLRAMGDSRTPLVFLMVTVVLNVALDIILMKYIPLGVEGAAWATVLSQAVSGLACLVYIAKKVPVLWLSRWDLKPDLRMMGSIAGLGIPMGLQFSITAVGSIMLQSAVNGLGTQAVAAVTAGGKVHNVVSAPLDTCGVAMATYCGQNLGAGRPDRIRKGVGQITAAAMAYCLLALGIVRAFGTSASAIFLEAPSGELLAQVEEYLLISTVAYPFLAVIFIFRNALQGMGFSREAMSAGVAELFARALAAFGLVGLLGFRAVCLASPLAWVFADVILLLLYRKELGRLSAAAAPAASRRRSFRVAQ